MEAGTADKARKSTFHLSNYFLWRANNADGVNHVVIDQRCHLVCAVVTIQDNQLVL